MRTLAGTQGGPGGPTRPAMASTVTVLVPRAANGSDVTPARLSRLAGALLLQVGHVHHLIGNLKRPCDFEAHGFAPPREPIDALTRPTLPLAARTPVVLVGPHLTLGAFSPEAAPALACLIAERLLITRNGSVSDRLWRLLFGDSNDPDAEPPPADAVMDARWLVEIPGHLWQIVRETVLKCS
jgi:hypothetical protein